MKIIVLTDAEYLALKSIIGNGWDDGDFEGWGGQRPKTQHSARAKFYKPFTTFRQIEKLQCEILNDSIENGGMGCIVHD